MIKSVHIMGTTLEDTYFQLLWNCYEHGREYEITEGSFKGSSRLEFDYVSGVINQPHDTEPLAPIFPEGVRPVTTDEKINKYFANYLMDPILVDGEEYKYAQWINGIVTPYPQFCKMIKCEKSRSVGRGRSTPLKFPKKLYYCRENTLENVSGKNFKCPLNKQLTPIEWVIKHFQQKGYGNAHCYINIGDPWSNFNYDIPYSNESERRTSPCLRGLDFKIKGGELVIHVIFRSWDLYAGWPQNMGGFILLNQYVASHLEGVDPGSMLFSSAGLHCYSYQIEPLKMILRKD